MAETITQITQPPEFIEAAAKPAITQLQQAVGQFGQADLSQVMGPQYTAGLGALTQQALGQAGGLGSYQPYLQAAAGLTGPTAYQQFMSPYQQDVIDTTLQEFDVQAAKGLPQLAAQAIGQGAFGGGREGVQRAEYQSASDRNRAALQAQLLQQGYGQAQQAAAQAFGQQQQLAAGQLGLGQAQIGLAQLAPSLVGQQIGALSALGTQQQAQEQARLQAQQQLAYQQAYQPLQTAQQYGAGIMGLISGYPGRETTQTVPTPSGLQTGLGVASTLAGIYSALNPRPLFSQELNE